MKICMVGYTKFEGDGRLHRYAMSLLEQGHSVDMVGVGESIQKKAIQILGVQVYRIQSRDFGESGPLSYIRHLMAFFWKSFLKVTVLQIKNRYDIIHFHNIPDFGVFCTLWAKFLGAKIILDIHDLVPEFYMRKFEVSETHPSIRFLKWIEKLSCQYADHVIIVTEIWRQTLLHRSVSPQKCSVVMNVPIDTIFKKLPLNPVKSGQPFFVTYHGNLAEQTGVDLLIRAVHQICDKIPNLQVLIVGGGRETDEYKQLCISLKLQKIVTFKNGVPVVEIANAVRHAHVAVDPKRSGMYAGETLSVKAMEYLAMGIPLIVARTKAASYYFSEKSVRFFEPDNETSLAEAILDLYRHPEKRKALHIHSDDFNRKYNWNKAKLEYFKILNRLMNTTSVA